MNFFSPPEWDADVPEESTHNNLTQKSKLKKRSKEQATASATLSDGIKSDSRIVDQNETKKSKKLRKEIPEISFASNVPSPSAKRKHDDNLNTTSNANYELKPSKKHKPNETNVSNSITSEICVKSSDSSIKKKQKHRKKEVNKILKQKHIPLLKFSNVHDEIEEVSMHNPPQKDKNKKLNRQGYMSTSISETPADVNDKQQGTSKNAKKKMKKAASADKPIGSFVKPVENFQKRDANAVVSAKTLKNRKRRSKKNKTDNKSTLNITSEIRSNTVVKNNADEITNEANSDVKPKMDSNIKPKVASSNYKKKLRDVLSMQTAVVNAADDAAVSENTKKNMKNDRKSRLLKPLRQRMVERLKGARFRYLNEQMYVKEGTDAQQLFKEDPKAFQAYHDGYRQQVNRWPLNPLDLIIKDISKMPKEYVIADLGCGDGRLGKTVPNKVHSFDLVSLDPSVKACDMSHTPLLTAEVNVVVFCLSLMGTNLKEYIIEANRVLKVGGLLKVAEVESRFENIATFLKDIQKYGFTLIKSDLNRNLFYFMDFKKDKDIKKRSKLPQLSLKPCYYKKR